MSRVNARPNSNGMHSGADRPIGVGKRRCWHDYCSEYVALIFR